MSHTCHRANMMTITENLQERKPLAVLPVLPQRQYSSFIAQAREVTEFCLEHGGKCFAGWEVKTLFAYVFFHLVDGGCFVVRRDGRAVAVLFAWGTDAMQILFRDTFEKPVFDWERSKEGSAIFVAEVITTPASRSALPKLFELAAGRWPDWRRKVIFTCRGGKLHELQRDAIERLIYGR